MPQPLNPIERLLDANVQWAQAVSKTQPDFFRESAKGQSPHTLWIGCADSRVPDSVITAAKPGDIFVHRNIANQLHLDDTNVLSVLRYAVDYLGVEHVVIVGHAGCGGAAACLGAAQSPNLSLDGPITTIDSLPVDSSLNRWLEPLTRLAASLQLSSIPHEEAMPILVEENVKAQVANLAKTHAINDAWTKGTRKGQNVWIHGWVYDLSTGLLKDLNISQGPPSKK
ncbi:Carbonic anhydrase 2 [Psilocybe cubensis]|uniref:Carbonic anhydrase n=2 Tax=Psilocybe cubensis TaxID=181762 RepID=A0A8H8CNS4_PSICU|nr:Carbonic anhydrase 2 [Psilocybe cubensis]KAH9483969.1 Carbonic anhydrase 2 [Psilocybe cubensis]